METLTILPETEIDETPTIEKDSRIAVQLQNGNWLIAGNEFTDLEVFIAKYFNHYLTSSTPPFLREIYGLTRGYERLVIGGARELAKSIALDVFVPSYDICQNNFWGQNQILTSKTAEISEQFLSIVTNEFQNNVLLQHDFPWLFPLKRISRDVIEFATGQLMSAKGKDYQIRGHISIHGRPTRIIIDDPEEPRDIESETARRTLEDWFDRSVLNAIAPKGQVILTGNIIDRLCLVYKVLNSKEKYAEWVKKVYPIMVNGKSIWEDRWSLERIEQKRKDIGFRAFQSEFLCQPVQPEDSLFHQEWVSYYDKLPEDTVFDYIAGIDPAGYRESGSNRNRDYWGFCITAKARTGEFKNHCYIIHWDRFRLPKESAFTKIIDVLRYKRPTEIFIEEVALSYLLSDLQDAIARANIYLPKPKAVVHGRTTGDLFTRLEGLTGMFETGQTHFKQEHQKLIFEELLPYPIVEHDDAMSGLEICLTRAKNKKYVEPSKQLTNPLIQRYGLIPDDITGRLK